MARFTIRTTGPKHCGWVRVLAALAWGGMSGSVAAGRELSIAGTPITVVSHSPKSSGVFLGSPSIAVLLDGSYVVSHDHFGPKSNEYASSLTSIFRSADRGRTWQRISEVRGAFWSSLFVHRNVLYLLGTNTHHGFLLIRASRDGGLTWTIPAGRTAGVLRDDGQYHCAPVPVIEHGGRIWRAMERRDPPRGWGITYRATVMSAPVESDLLKAENWTVAEPLSGDKAWLAGAFGGWLEGNAVVDRGGTVRVILRVVSDHPEKAAMLRVSANGRQMSFDPAEGFVPFPGGAKKFSIKYDNASDRYWSLANIVQPDDVASGRPGALRNTLALVTSIDLQTWETRRVVLHHPDVKHHGFQYADWIVDGEDILAVVRTSADDGLGGAENFHDSNFITFHRIGRFRR